MGGKEKKMLSMPKVAKYQGSEKLPNREQQMVTPPRKYRSPDDMSPPKKVARMRSDGKLTFFHYLERVGTMRCFWELKHIELEGLGGFEEVS
ncbi:hypothetical protein AALO_G00018020 [Alosa alosa]|uniref:Uncharacterized protein n=1 Tax=Alosa alosa TaxID=278164 RepID=A0AAV6HK12_9TELE|nr:hypothetical protein AALO_G00018020 [Alosa alosa]